MTESRWTPDAFVWSVPEEERPGRPLLVLLHGLGADEHDLAALAPHLPPGIVTVSVRAPLRYGTGYAWFDRGLPGDEALAAATQGDRSLRSWLRSLTGHSSLGVLGFSQGAAVAVSVARAEPESVDHVVQIAGFPSPIDAGRPAASAPRARSRTLPVFSGHGGRDQVVPPAAAESLAAWLRANTDLTERRYPDAAHEITAGMLDDIVAFLRAHAR